MEFHNVVLIIYRTVSTSVDRGVDSIDNWQDRIGYGGGEGGKMDRRGSGIAVRCLKAAVVDTGTKH